MISEGQLWVIRRIDDIINTMEIVASKERPIFYSDERSYVHDIIDETLNILYDEDFVEPNSDSFTKKYASILSIMEDMFYDQLKDYFESVKSGYSINENFDKILDIYRRKNNGEQIKPSDKDMLKSFKKFIDNGGDPEDFIYNIDDDYDIDDREGKKFIWERFGTTLVYTFSEEYIENNEINYFGEITFMGDEYLGVISTDKRGFLVGYDFYSVLDDNLRLQNILKDMGREHEITHFFAEEIIPVLRR
jgi:hypothetical protein